MPTAATMPTAINTLLAGVVLIDLARSAACCDRESVESIREIALSPRSSVSMSPRDGM